MSQVHKRLATLLGLSAEASEEAVLTELEKRAHRLRGEVGAELGLGVRNALGLGADAKGDAVSAAIERLEEKVQAGEKREVEALVQAAVDGMRITPAEKGEFVAMGLEGPAGRARMERMLAARVPMAPSGAPPATPPRPRAESRALAQRQAIETWMQAHPGSGPGDAVVALAREKPELFGAADIVPPQGAAV